MRMSTQEIGVFQAALRSASCYLEYGVGGSTKLAAAVETLASITAVESDPEYFRDHVASDPAVASAVTSGRLRFLAVDIGPTGEWGIPKDESRSHLWPNYALCPFVQAYRPDLILIDGRFRVACGIVAALAAPNAVVLVHDYTIRRRYRLLERFFVVEEVIDTLARCRRRPVINERAAQRLLRHFLYAPSDESRWLPPGLQRFLGRIRRKLKKN